MRPRVGADPKVDAGCCDQNKYCSQTGERIEHASDAIALYSRLIPLHKISQNRVN